jgi:predicted kinase
MLVPLICHILIGSPGCGKSTFVTQLNQLYSTAKIVSTDQIRKELFGDESIQGNWTLVEEQVIAQIQEAIQAERTVIYDATNAKKEWRLALLKQLTDFSLRECSPMVQWKGWYLQTPLEVCKLWNKQRNRQVPELVIEELFRALQDNPPHTSEGFVAVNCLDLSSQEFDGQHFP